MRPTLLQIDTVGLVVRSAPALLLAALLCALAVGPLWAERLDGIPRRVTFRILAVLALAAVTGGHLHFLVNQPSLAGVLAPWEGLHAGGAVLAILAAAPLLFAYHQVHAGRIADAMMPVTGLSICIARLGCFLHGCCFGMPCTGPWCLPFPPASAPAVFHAQQQLVPHGSWSLPVHPLQLYFGLTGIVITVLATWLLPRRRYPGQVALLGLLLFSLSAYWLEPFRQAVGSRPFIGSRPQLQVVASWLVAIAILGLVACEGGHRLRRGPGARARSGERRREARPLRHRG